MRARRFEVYVVVVNVCFILVEKQRRQRLLEMEDLGSHFESLNEHELMAI